MTYSNPIAEPTVAPGRTNTADRIATLTPTQMRVLRHVAVGFPNKQIAYELGISEATVKVHMTALMRKLDARNRTQVAIFARTGGIFLFPEAT